MTLLRCSSLVALVAAFFLLLSPNAGASLVTYQFSGTVTVFDNQGMLGDIPDVLDCSGSFVLETDGDSPYAVTDVFVQIGGDYTFSSVGDIAHWTQRDEDAVVGGKGFSSSLETILGLPYRYGVYLFLYGASPGDNSAYTSGRIEVRAQQAGPDSWPFSFNGDLDEFVIQGAPVPIPGAAWLLFSGLTGLVALRRRRR